MPRPNLKTFIDALRYPSEQLRNSLGGGALRLLEGSNGAYICTQSHHTEARVCIENRELLLALPHDSQAELTARNTAARMASIRSAHLGYYHLLEHVLSYFDSMGRRHSASLVAEPLPAGHPLSELLQEGLSARQIREAASELCDEFCRLGIAHNNLKAENLWLTPEGRLVAVRCHRMSFEGPSECDRKALEALCRLAEKRDNKAINLSEEPEYRLRQKPELEFVGRLSDGLIRICQKGLYGYADCHDRVVIAPRFLWADDFREGRAEVECKSGFGVIDKQGEFVVNPCFEQIEWDDMETTIRGRLSDQEMLFGYNGEVLIRG